MRQTCPLCRRRTTGVVDPDCIVCEGIGVIGLGTYGIVHHGADVTGRAVELYLEAAAREATTDLPIGQPRLNALHAAVTRLRDLGVITAPLGVTEPSTLGDPLPTHTLEAAAARAAFLMGATVTPSDAANTTAPPIRYNPDDRPRATGLLPTTSQAGYPSALARVGDPTDALGPDTRAHVYADQAAQRQAHVLASAIDTAAAKRARATR